MDMSPARKVRKPINKNKSINGIQPISNMRILNNKVISPLQSNKKLSKDEIPISYISRLNSLEVEGQ
jgi:hypothetical protein